MSRTALYLQSIRGPLVLITLGVLFAMHQADFISFSRTWPLIIIVVGLVKLVERLVAPPVSYPPGGYPQQTPPVGGPRL
jgi:hypothetical protein